MGFLTTGESMCAHIVMWSIIWTQWLPWYCKLIWKNIPFVAESELPKMLQIDKGVIFSVWIWCLCVDFQHRMTQVCKAAGPGMVLLSTERGHFNKGPTQFWAKIEFRLKHLIQCSDAPNQSDTINALVMGRKSQGSGFSYPDQKHC